MSNNELVPYLGITYHELSCILKGLIDRASLLTKKNTRLRIKTVETVIDNIVCEINLGLKKTRCTYIFQEEQGAGVTAFYSSKTSSDIDQLLCEVVDNKIEIHRPGICLKFHGFKPIANHINALTEHLLYYAWKEYDTVYQKYTQTGHGVVQNINNQPGYKCVFQNDNKSVKTTQF